MKELVASCQLNLTSNMSEVKAYIAEMLATKYDVIVSEDRLFEAKAQMAELNKDKRKFSLACKEVIDKISPPIMEFKSDQKDIEQMYDDVRNDLASQVKKFEDIKLEKIKSLILTYSSEKCSDHGIDENSISILDLVKLSAVSTTKSGYTLTKKTTDAIAQRIQAIENEILKERMRAEEKAKYEREIAEKARIEAEEKARLREIALIEKSAREKELAVQNERLRVESVERAKVENQSQRYVAPPPKQAIQEAKAPDVILEDGKAIFTVAVTFKIIAPASASSEKIRAKITSMMASIGITSLESLEVTR